jgi:ABC-type sugar transport system ATPase subunit
VNTALPPNGSLTESDTQTPIAVDVVAADKSFPGVHAVKGVSLRLAEGETHGLVGENGAGKSTLVKMISGAVAPDAGHIEVFGRPLDAGSPVAAREAGVAAIYQEPNVIPKLSPVANVFLGQEQHRFGLIAEQEMRQRFREWCELLDVRLPVRGSAGALSIGAQQSIEIIRALESGARVVIMDEPTAALARTEVEALYRMVDILRTRKTTIIFISHKLEEVLQLCENVTVMRDGRKVLSSPATRATVDQLVTAMLGDRLEKVVGHDESRESGRRRRPTGSVLLRVEGLTVPGVLSDVHLDIREGEMLGIAGLVGSGRTSLLRSLAGAEPAATGHMTFADESVPWPTTPWKALQLGIALAPENRRTEGLVPLASAAENVCIPSLRRVGTHGLIWRRRVVNHATGVARRVGFPAGRLRARSATLSGGNQQKIVLAKWLFGKPRLLLVDEPVRGIDVGAKAEIFALLQELVEQGMTIVMVSEETEELIALVDRMVVLRRGTVAGVLQGAEMQEEAILRLMFPTTD